MAGPAGAHSLLSEFDGDGDGTFDRLESNAVGEGILPNLEMFNYFTYNVVDGKPLDPVAPTDFVASDDGEPHRHLPDESPAAPAGRSAPCRRGGGDL